MRSKSPGACWRGALRRRRLWCEYCFRKARVLVFDKALHLWLCKKCAAKLEEENASLHVQCSSG